MESGLTGRLFYERYACLPCGRPMDKTRMKLPIAIILPWFSTTQGEGYVCERCAAHSLAILYQIEIKNNEVADHG